MIDRTAKYLSHGDGRDKFCKMIQYAARFSMHHTQSDPETSQKCRNLFGKLN
jgi:hypothetical protein